MKSTDPEMKKLAWRKSIVAKAYGDAVAFREVLRVLVEHQLVDEQRRIGRPTSMELLEALVNELATLGESMQMTFSYSPDQLESFKATLKPR